MFGLLRLEPDALSARSDAIQYQRLQALERLLEECRIIQRLAGDGFDLHAEVGVVLGGCPERKDQMMRTDCCQLAGIYPGLDHGDLVLDKLTQGLLQLAQQQRRALHDFHAEQPGFFGMVAGEFELDAQVVADRLDRVLLG